MVKPTDGFMRLDRNYLGRNCCEAFKNPDEPSKIFEALISISKVNLYLRELNMAPWAKEQKDKPTMHYNSEMPCYYHFIQSLVILEGKLIGAKLDADGAIMLIELSYISFETEYTLEKYERKRFYPDVISLDYFGEYLNKTENGEMPL